MKILLIVDDYLPHSIKVAAKMMHELACEFKKRGYIVTVITPDITLKSGYSYQIIDGINVYYFKSGKIKNVNLIKRAINELLLPFRAMYYLKKFFKHERHDYILYYSPTIFWGPLVSRLKKKWGVPSYLILRDLFPQWVIDNGTLKKHSPITLYFKFFEKLNYRSADCVALQSPKNLEWFNNSFKVKADTNLLYNWADNRKTDSDGSFRREHNLENKVIFFYGGNIGKAQDMMNIVRLAEKMLPQKNAFFLVLGEGDEVDLIRHSILDKNLTNMIYLPSVSQDKFKSILAEVDVGLFTLNKDHQTHNFPGKLLGYMVQSLPILGSVNRGNDLKDVIEEYDAGYVSINGEDDELHQNCLSLLNDKGLRISKGLNANQLLRNVFSVESAVNKIINFFNSNEYCLDTKWAEPLKL